MKSVKREDFIRAWPQKDCAIEEKVKYFMRPYNGEMFVKDDAIEWKPDRHWGSQRYWQVLSTLVLNQGKKGG